MKKKFMITLFSFVLFVFLPIQTLAMDPPLPERPSHPPTKQKFDKINAEKFFLQQNKKFSHGEIIKLIEKGQGIISALLRNEKPENIFNEQHLNVFGDCGRRFAKHYKTVSMTSLTNIVYGGRPAEETQRRQGHLEAVIAVAWAIAYASCSKGELFDRGSFSIKDDNELLNKFLEYYAVEASGKRMEELTYLSGSNFAYGRHKLTTYPGEIQLSSHYPGQTLRQTGIDARFENNAESLKILPFEHTHILFGRVRTHNEGKIKTFFKLEGSGLGDMYNFLHHSKTFSEDAGDPTSMRREKDILPIVKENFGTCVDEFIGWNEKTKQTILTYEALQKNKKKNDTEWDSSSLSINEMACAIKDLLQVQQQQKQMLERFLTTLEACNYSKDDLIYRTGNEVILSLEDIVDR